MNKIQNKCVALRTKYTNYKHIRGIQAKNKKRIQQNDHRKYHRKISQSRKKNDGRQVIGAISKTKQTKPEKKFSRSFYS